MFVMKMVPQQKTPKTNRSDAITKPFEETCHVTLSIRKNCCGTKLMPEMEDNQFKFETTDV